MTVKTDAKAKTADEKSNEQQQNENNAEQIQELNKKIVEVQQTAEEHWEKVLRLQAEMENLRRRQERELENAHKYAVEKFAAELINIFDSLELGLQSAASEEAGVTALREGMELTLKMFHDLMERFDIVIINPKGERFDSKYHEAMTMQESADAAPDTVIAVIQKGYMLHNRLLRPARVIVSKSPENKEKIQGIDTTA